MSSIAIIVVSYKRIDCFKRLLASLDKADYGSDKVPLIISIDKSDSTIIESEANSFEWKYGDKIINARSENMGLRRHILSCGEYLNTYDAVVILEDDLVVSKGFYSFAKQAVEKYNNDDGVAGISLYSYRINEFSFFPFEPERNVNSDVYFMKFASSWGQIWMKKQWKKFMGWYHINQDLDLHTIDELPEYIANWGKNSWKKYHIAYCVLNDKYFVYPYDSYSNNPGDIGEHYKKKDYKFGVPLAEGTKKDYCFLDSNDTNIIKYDGYFERVTDDDICFDLYGAKKKYEKRYVASLKNLPYKVTDTYKLEMHPHEINVLSNNIGDELFVYDTEKAEKNSHVTIKYNDLIAYYYRFCFNKMPVRNALFNGFDAFVRGMNDKAIKFLVWMKHTFWDEIVHTKK